MNCDGLRADIDKLKNGLSVLESDIEKIRKTEGRYKELQEVMKSIDSSSVDPVLEKYLKDFQEQNLDILPVVSFGDRIDIRDVNGKPATITSIVTTGDGRALIGGSRGVLYEGFYNDHGELELGERIDIRDVSGKPATIASIVTVEDGRVLIGGQNGTLYSGSYDEQGRLILDERIDIRNASGNPAYIRAITALDDKRIPIGGSWGVLYAGSYNDQGELELGERIDIKDIYGYSADINSIAATKDGRVLIGGLMGTLYAGAFDISFETLKQHLPEIIKKGESGER